MKMPEETQGTARHPFDDELCVREMGMPRVNSADLLRKVAQVIRKVDQQGPKKARYDGHSEISLLVSDLEAADNLDLIAERLQNTTGGETLIPSKPHFCAWCKDALEDCGINPETVTLEYHNEKGWLFMPEEIEKIFATFFGHEQFQEGNGSLILKFQEYGCLNAFRTLAANWPGNSE